VSVDVALTFDFDAEEVWIGEDPANAERPGVLSQGTYGAKVAIPLILELLERHGVRATFFTPGRVGERHPGRVREILAAGHEVALHGHTHRSPANLSRDEEAAELVRARDVLGGLGAEPVGYRSPSWEFSRNTVALLAEHGLRYSSNFMDDLRPYRHPGTDLIELPVQWLLDDAAHFWFSGADWTKAIATTAAVEAIWREEFEGIRRHGGTFVLTMHPQIIGRLGRRPGRRARRHLRGPRGRSGMRALVTGAARGLGAGIAERLAGDGAEVAPVDVSPAVLEVRTGHGIVADVADEAQAEAAFAAALDALGGLDLLVNAAGIGGPDSPVADTPTAAFRRTLDVNLVGAFVMARAAARVMTAQATGGAIVNVGSLFGQQGVAGGAAYCASKGGLALLTQSLALELAPHAITVNTIAPGNMATEMHFDELRSRARRSGRSFDEELELARAQVPLGRHGTADDVAGTVAWLASPDASYVTGQTIAVNGGVLLS
jgi:peptidoglycan-N-acetylglucosamine deacetylase